MIKLFKELYSFKYLIRFLVVTELKLRYRKSILGFVWTLLNPLLSMAVLAFVFTTIFPISFKGRSLNLGNYASFLFAGITPWLFFSNAITYGAGCITNSEYFIKKIYIPRFIFPLVNVSSAYINFLFSLIALFILALFVEIKVSYALLFLPIPMINLYLMTLGFVLVFSVITVYFRDFLFLLNILVSLWFYLTPILYDLSSFQTGVSSPLFNLLIKFEYINPMYYIVVPFQDILFYAEVPATHMMVKSTITAFILLTIGYLVFNKFNKRLIFKL